MGGGDVPGGVHEYDPTTRKGGEERQDEPPLATRIQCVCVVGGVLMVNDASLRP